MSLVAWAHHILMVWKIFSKLNVAKNLCPWFWDFWVPTTVFSFYKEIFDLITLAVADRETCPNLTPIINFPAN
jgi:hypothetical protein